MNTSIRILSFATAIFALGQTTSALAAGPTSGQIIIRGTAGSLCEIVVDYGTNLDSFRIL